MAYQVWHDIWYGLDCLAWYMVWPGKHGMVYGMALQAWHGICYGLVGIAWYMLLLGSPGMVYGMSWQAWHGIWYCLVRVGMVCGVGWQDDVYCTAWRAWHMVYVEGSEIRSAPQNAKQQNALCILIYVFCFLSLFSCWSCFFLYNLYYG